MLLLYMPYCTYMIWLCKVWFSFQMALQRPRCEASEKLYRQLGPGRHTLADLVTWQLKHGPMRPGVKIILYIYVEYVLDSQCYRDYM